MKAGTVCFINNWSSECLKEKTSKGVNIIKVYSQREHILVRRKALSHHPPDDKSLLVYSLPDSTHARQQIIVRCSEQLVTVI